MQAADPLPKSLERKLAARAADGDSDAVGELYDAYERKLFGYCTRITGNPEDAADATQEAFCNVIQRLPGLDTETLNFGAYLFTSARNACMDLLKAQGRFQTTDEVPEDPFGQAPIETEPERALLTGEQQRAAREANAALPEKQRAVLAMREIAELSYDDIALALDMNQNSVAQLISRARLNFQKQLRAGSVVLAPTGPDDQRALELTAARMDGQIKDEDLSWLNAHLQQSEVSRVNAEAMQESTKLYRAIGPIVVLAGLREVAVARASESVRQGERSFQADAPTEQVEAFSGDTEALEADPATTNERSNSRRRLVAGAIAAVILILLIAATTSGMVGDEPEATVSGPTPPTGATSGPASQGEPRSSNSKNSQKSSTAPANNQAQAPQASPRSKNQRSQESDKKQNDDGASKETPPPSDPPVATQPETPAPSTPDPGTPGGGGGGGGIPGGPGDFCASPPCTPPPPVP